MEKLITPKILSDKVFKEDTYTIEHTKSSLKLNETDKAILDNNWQTFLEKAQSKGSQVWDGTFYRLENVEDIVSGSKKLIFSTIKYSQVRGIINSPNRFELSNKILTNQISTASLIRTTDGYFIFGVRNSNSANISKIDLIGGGLHKNEIIVNKFSDVFNNQLKEIREETDLTDKDIENIQGIGIVHSSYSNILFIFFTQLKKSKSEVQKIFSKNNDDEMVDLDFVEEKFLREYLKDKGSYRILTAELYFRNIGEWY